MANLKDCGMNFNIDDDYYTPKWVWEKLVPLIPKDKIIWEACMLNATNSKSLEIWEELGYNVLGDKTWDILNCDIPNCDIIVTNIPFDIKIKVPILKRLIEIDKPFIIIMSAMAIFSNYFHEIMPYEHIQIIIPRQKLHYCRNGEPEKKNTSFYSVFIAYKMKLNNKELFIN